MNNKGRKFGPKQLWTPPPRPTLDGYKHMEAFCLMVYECERCHLMELLWNSRDGATPMFIGCRACGSMMHHATHIPDVRNVNHTPFPGQRVFIDMPESIKMPCARFAVFLGQQVGNPLPEGKTAEELSQAIAQGYHEGEPWIIEWPR